MGIESYRARRAYLSGGYKQDGYPHTRAADGVCLNCGAMQNEPHYTLVKRPETTPIYDKLLEEHSPCGVLGHDGFWEDEQVERGIWYCRDENIEIHIEF